MTDVFEYRPKFVDIRVKKPVAEDDYTRTQMDRPCDHVGCERAGSHRAPKGRDRVNEYWHFCREHVADYNKRWNYFAGMTDSEFADFQAHAEIGHRPTWTFRAGRGDRMAAAARGFQAGSGDDPFGIFGSPQQQAPVQPRRRLSRLHGRALEAMSLQEDAQPAQIRARYAELVKRWHPDSNNGDRACESNLQRIVQAYQTLKAGGLV